MSELQEDSEDSWRDSLYALYRTACFRPALTVGVVLLSFFAALLEGIGLSFIMPIVELAQTGDPDPDEAGTLLRGFIIVYEGLGIPFTLGFLVAGVSIVMVLRYASSFLVGWLRAAIETYYARHLQKRAFDAALDAEVAYFDQEGSDDILNAIVTQAEYAGRVISSVIQTLEKTLLAAMYLAVALYLAPLLTLATVVFFGTLTLTFRNVLGSGYSLGDRIADANERIQAASQAGTQGIRDVKVFRMSDELRERFERAIDDFTVSSITYARNKEAITNFYNLTTAVSVFLLIYVALRFTSLSLGALGVFLFAMFQLGPVVSSLNKLVYTVEGDLPHLVRTQRFIDELESRVESIDDGDLEPGRIDEIRFEDVDFTYETNDEQVIHDISFSMTGNEFIAFVGPSGAGKSTIASLMARLYEPDDGRIVANGTPIDRFDVEAWRSKIALVRQDPHLFNDTLYRNITVGNRDASREDVDRVCEIARITEFFDELPEGYDTKLGDQGVKLSGGQRQRVAIARALLTDADILILDEATSDLDTALEQQVQEAIESMNREYTIVAIAHRLSTVKNANVIHTLEQGEIVESGTHAELLDNDGIYNQLYNAQVLS